jgi:hypothetical protein
MTNLEAVVNTRLMVVLTLASLAPAALPAQTRDDTLGIRAAAMDYIEGWWSGSTDRMARALHPALVKRIMAVDSAGNARLGEMGASLLVHNVRMGGGTRTPAAERRTDYRLLDIFQNAAVARIDAGGWIDYLQLVRWEGRWVIVNVLWEVRRPTGR